MKIISIAIILTTILAALLVLVVYVSYTWGKRGAKCQPASGKDEKEQTRPMAVMNREDRVSPGRLRAGDYIMHDGRIHCVNHATCRLADIIDESHVSAIVDSVSPLSFQFIDLSALGFHKFSEHDQTSYIYTNDDVFVSLFLSDVGCYAVVENYHDNRYFKGLLHGVHELQHVLDDCQILLKVRLKMDENDRR